PGQYPCRVHADAQGPDLHPVTGLMLDGSWSSSASTYERKATRSSRVLVKAYVAEVLGFRCFRPVGAIRGPSAHPAGESWRAARATGRPRVPRPASGARSAGRT